MDEQDTQAKSSGQIGVDHEFGHALGLNHPGTNLQNVINVYDYKGKDQHGNEVNGSKDLMGTGTGKRAFYFKRWEDGVEKKLPKCGKWNTKLAVSKSGK